MTGGDTGRLRWVIWLLAIAVLLPSAGLLWLVGRGMQSERLAVRQRLEETYRRLADAAVEELEETWRQFDAPHSGEVDRAARFHAWMDAGAGGPTPDTVLVYTPDPRLVYPPLPAGEAWTDSSGDDPVFRSAWRLEFVARDPGAAAAAYRRAVQGNTSADLRLAGLAAAVRCLEKAGRAEEAMDLASDVLQTLPPAALNGPQAGRLLRLRLHYIELLAEGDAPAAHDEAHRLIEEILAPRMPLEPTPDRHFVLRRALDPSFSLHHLGLDPELTARARRALDAESMALNLLEEIEYPSRLALHPERVLFAVDGAVGAVIEEPEGPVVLIYGVKTLIDFLSGATGRHLPEGVHLAVTPPGTPTPGPSAGVMLLQADLGTYFPGWRMLWIAEDGGALDAVARRQTALYAWIGLLVIGLLVSAGTVSIQLVSREMRFHRLKNDFVATVTHELKTPLASTRVLVDTLLENGAEDTRQRTEYLEMIARENCRLSALIDRFLTFSRMERGKHTIVPEPCDPGELVRNAVEAAQMHCRDTTTIDIDVEPDLPSVAADPDAMVTVLVNLLDNAVKYTGRDKQIGIRVSRSRDGVAFAVHDNGVGIPRRAWKRIFATFYQVDQSLSRSVGGCGLGLSIVDFIVRQHGGRVAVSSRVGAGSIFTVVLPVAIA